jgi:stage III sporulation protein SpoIIIAA
MAGRDRALIVVVEHGGPTMFARIGVLRAYRGMSESGHRSCKCGAVYDRSEHIEEAREISGFECAVCGKTIENWNSAWVPRYRFIACPAGKSE